MKVWLSQLCLRFKQSQISPKNVFFIAQLVEHCSANAEAMGSNPVEAPKTFFGFNCDCFNRKLNCDDHTFISCSQLSTCKTPRLRIELGPNWCEASALTYGGPHLPRQNLLFHGKTYFSIPSFQSVSAYAFPRRRSGNFQQSNMADGEEDYVWVIHALFKSMSVCNSRQTLSLV